MTSSSSNSAVEPNIYCKQCGYDLRACLDNRCSECGRKYDPEDPKTFARRPERKRWHTWLKRRLIFLLALIALPSAAWGWLYWDWWEEQQSLTKLKGLFEESGTVFIGPDELSDWLFSAQSSGPEWLVEYLRPVAFVLERVSRIKATSPMLTNDHLATLKALKWLEYLSVCQPQISDISSLTGLTRLKALCLTNTTVYDLAPLSKLTALEELDVSSTNVSDLSPLTNLKALHKLDISHTPVFDLSALSKLMRLKCLSANNTSVSDLSPLSSLTELTELHIWDTAVNDLSPLFKLTGLRQLNINREAVSETQDRVSIRQDQVEELRRALPECGIQRY